MSETRQIHTTGRRGCVACIEATIYTLVIVAIAESDHITINQMRKALKSEFPNHTFYANPDGGQGYLRMDASR